MPSLDTSYRRFSRVYAEPPATPPTPAPPAATVPRPATRRVDFLATFLAALRLQDKPRLSAYAVLCHVARFTDGIWQKDIDDALSAIMGPQCEILARQGLLTLENRKRQGARSARWVTLTAKGTAYVAALLNPQPGQSLLP